MFESLFNRRGLSLDRLRSFLEVADVGAIARAAPGDPIRQSQLSRQISELEEFFGVALVERRGRGLGLTTAGTRLTIVVRELLQGLSEIAADAGAQPVATTLGTGDHLLHAWIIPRIAHMPSTVALALALAAMDGAEAVTRLLDARLDFGVVAARHVVPGLRSRALGSVEYALFVPRVLRPKRRGSFAELLASVPIAAQSGDPELAEILSAALREAGSAPALICETFPQAQRAVQSTAFAAVLPTLVRADLPARLFDEVPLPSSPTRKLVLAWHSRLERQRPRVAAFGPQLAELFSLPRALRS